MSRAEKPYVLLVDDNDALCTLVTALLRRDFDVDCALDGVEAIERLRVANYAAILLDLRMPNLDGYGVLDFLREHNAELLPRVLVLSAALTRAEVKRVDEYGVCGVLAKPFDVDTLLNAVRQCVGDNGRGRVRMFSSSVIFLIADLLKHRFL